MTEPAETRYAKAADGAHLAYQIVGDGPIDLLLAASHPDRVSALILINAFARLVRAPDYEPGVPAALVANFQESLVDPAQEPLADDVDLIAPSLADDPEFRAWWRRSGNRG